MPAPANVHVDTLLTGVAAGYSNSDYIADKVMPIVRVSKESGKIAVYGVEHFRLDFQPRAMGADTPDVDWAAGPPVSFAADEWTVEKPVDDREVQLYDEPFDAYRDATNLVQEKILLKREDVVGTLMTTAGNFGGTTPGNAWSGAGTPKVNIRDAIVAVVGRTGIAPTRLYGVTSFDVWMDLVANTTITNLFINTSPGEAGLDKLTTKAVANALGLADIFVGSAIKLTSKEGDANVFAPVWGSTTFAVVALSPAPSLMQPGWGVMLSPTVPGMSATVAIDRYRSDKKKSEVIRATALFEAVKVTAEAGQLITGLS